MLLRLPNADFNLSSMAQSLIFSSFASLKIGMEKLAAEDVRISKLLGHGGLFKTKTVAQRLMASALDVPVAVMSSAGEGGAWGIALLASYMRNKDGGETLEAYLDNKVFGENKGTTVTPDKTDVDGFNQYMTRYKAAVAVEKAAIDRLK